MILPHEPKNSNKVDALSPIARKVYPLLYDMVDGFASDKPVWAVTRYIVRIQDIVYGTEHVTLVEPGWRAIPSLNIIPLARSPLWNVNLFSASDRKARIYSIERLVVEPPTMTVAELILQMEKTGLGRPATYASHTQKLLNRGLIKSLTEATLTIQGEKLLKAIRDSSARRFNADFTRSMLSDLDDIENGKLSTEDGFAHWLSPEVARMAEQWLQTQTIEGDVATVAYEAREQQDRRSIYWPAGAVPRSIDPEFTLPPACFEREQRAQINMEASKLAPDWLTLSHHERVDLRIAYLATQNDLSVEQWKANYVFDILSRWKVGWLP
jgi:hypothetical protein